MKFFTLCFVLVALTARAAACSCHPKTSEPPAAATAASVHSAQDPTDAAAMRYPLRGEIVQIFADRSALLVRHDEIPGVMRAMTMLLQVDAATLASAPAPGTAITGELVKRADGWWLENVRPAAAEASTPPPTAGTS
jgi:hypothetical protein